MSVPTKRSEKRRPVGRPPGRSASRERFDRRRFEVLQAAARTFNAKGFHLATLDDVADELGVTKPALYYYADSKDELLSACGQLALDALKGALDRTDKDASGRDRLRHFFRLYGEVICQDFGRCLVFTQPRDLAPKSRLKTIAGRRALNNAIRAMIVDGVKDGSLRPCDDRALAMAMFDAFNGLARWYDASGPIRLSSVVEQYLAIFLCGVQARP